MSDWSLETKIVCYNTRYEFSEGINRIVIKENLAERLWFSNNFCYVLSPKLLKMSNKWETTLPHSTYLLMPDLYSRDEKGYVLEV